MMPEEALANVVKHAGVKQAAVVLEGGPEAVRLTIADDGPGFDPAAPARPVRIGLPIDPTPAGLRKFDKKTFLVMSDLLCGQVSRFKGMTLGDLVRSVLPWPLHKDLDVGKESACAKGAGVGMVCSLSIPIVTICALILLMIMVSLLDLIFRWLPWFFMCLPIPGLKGKK